MARLNSSAPNLTTEEFYQLVADTALHMAELRGFRPGSLSADWRQAKQRVLTVISDIGSQYDGNTKLFR